MEIRCDMKKRLQVDGIMKEFQAFQNDHHGFKIVVYNEVKSECSFDVKLQPLAEIDDSGEALPAYQLWPPNQDDIPQSIKEVMPAISDWLKQIQNLVD